MCNVEAPLCTSCGHHHEQGVKCLICGHVGKSQIFAKMRSKADERRDTRLLTFAQSGSALVSAVQSSSAQLLQGLIEHCQYAYEMDSDKIMGNTSAALVGLASNHTVLFGGDLFIASLAFDLVPMETSLSASPQTFRLVVRHLLVDPAYRGRAYAYTLLRHALLEVDRLGLAIQSISAVCRSDSTVVPKLQQLGFAHDVALAAEVARTVNSVMTTPIEPNLSVYTADLSPFQCKVDGVLEFIATRLR